MAASSMFGTVFDAQVFAEAFSWCMTLGEAEIGTLMSMSFMVGGEVITGLALYEMYKKTCGLKEEFKDLSLKDKQKMAVFLKTLPGAPKFEEIITPKQVKKSKPVNKKLIYYHSKEGFKFTCITLFKVQEEIRKYIIRKGFFKAQVWAIMDQMVLNLKMEIRFMIVRKWSIKNYLVIHN